MEKPDFKTLDNTGQMIMEKAFKNPNDWRTLGGIARATGFTVQEVERYVHEHSSLFMQIPISIAGTVVYRLNLSVAHEMEIRIGR